MRKKFDEEGREMTFWEHLDELRSVLIRGIIAIVVIMIVAFSFKHILFDYIILAPKNSDFITYRLLCKFGKFLGTDSFCLDASSLHLININLAGQFMAHMTTSIIAGVIVASPYIVWELWRFIAPGLTPEERRNTRGAVFVISGLFLTGVLFSYFLAVPLMVNFLGNYQVSESVTNQIALTSYTSAVVTMTLLMGLIFEFPVIVLFLTKIGILTPKFMSKHRKHTIIGILVVAGLITPSPDIFSQLVVALPLYALYEISVQLSKKIYKAREKALDSE
ncbi:MAG: twin-arginine translocase subunit TatC [Bacteroidetes bacterium]|nr:twin-arginine translocase subunit TatC [Bacteroidota bacterium]